MTTKLINIILFNTTVNPFDKWQFERYIHFVIAKQERDHIRNLRGKDGKLRVIDASMFAGKTERLITLAKRLDRSGIPTQVFKHPLDNRYEGDSTLNSHSGLTHPCQAFAHPYEVYLHIKPDTLVVLWDEMQFYTDPFNPENAHNLHQATIAVVEQLAHEGRLVIVAGLGLDFKGEGFGPMPELLAHASLVEKLTAVCAHCGSLEADRTQRLIDGEPATYSSDLIVVGAEEAYEARCRDCHQVPGKLSFKQQLDIFLTQNR